MEATDERKEQTTQAAQKGERQKQA